MLRTRSLRIVALTIAVITGGTLSYLFLSQPPALSVVATCAHKDVAISDYSPERDQENVVSLFERDWYWLSVNEYTREHVLFMLNTHSPNEFDSRYFGTMKISVMRNKQGAFLGFITYYMKNFHQGHILFLAIHQDFRGKRYADCLLEYAIKALKEQGAQEVLLLTYTPNTSGIKLYNRFGFVETHREGKFVYFKYKV